MAIKFANEIIEEIEARGEIIIPEGCVTGEEYEAWLYEEPLLILGQDGCFECEENTLFGDDICIDNAYSESYGEAA